MINIYMNENLCDVLDSNKLTLNGKNDITFNETEHYT
jgi:hypothetical protein